MSQDMFRIVAPAIIALLIIWLIYRIKQRIRVLIKNEIYNNFPAIKNTINDFEQRLNNFNSQIDMLEHKVKELIDKIK
jgi:peptidoglycan hydrolase CwlO-like protein